MLDEKKLGSGFSYSFVLHFCGFGEPYFMKKTLIWFLMLALVLIGSVFVFSLLTGFKFGVYTVPFYEWEYSNFYENDFFELRYIDGAELTTTDEISVDENIWSSECEFHSKTVHIEYGDRYADIEIHPWFELKENRIRNEHGRYIGNPWISNCCKLYMHYEKRFGMHNGVWIEENNCDMHVFKVLIPMNGSYVDVYAGSMEPNGEGYGGPDNKNLAVLRNIISTLRVKDSYYDAFEKLETEAIGLKKTREKSHWDEMLGRRFDNIEDLITITDEPVFAFDMEKSSSDFPEPVGNFESKYFSVSVINTPKARDIKECGYKNRAEKVTLYADSAKIVILPTWDKNDIKTDTSYKRIMIGNILAYISSDRVRMKSQYYKIIYYIPMDGWVIKIYTEFCTEREEYQIMRILQSLKITNPNYLPEIYQNMGYELP